MKLIQHTTYYYGFWIVSLQFWLGEVQEEQFHKFPFLDGVVFQSRMQRTFRG